MKTKRQLSFFIILAVTIGLLSAFNSVVFALAPCSQHSPLDCGVLRIAAPVYTLEWNVDHGYLADGSAGAGVGTGFTLVHPSTNDEPGGDAAAPSYLKSKLQVDTANSVLKVTSTPGLNVNVADTQMNPLAIGVLPNKAFTIETTIKNLDLTGGTAGNQQAGIWFGTSEGNYIKLVAIRTSAGAYQIEFGKEFDNVYAPNSLKSNTDGNTLKNGNLRLVITWNPTTKVATGQFATGAGALQNVGGGNGQITNVEQIFVDGVNVADAAVGKMVFAGIMTSQRTSSVAPVVSFDKFTFTRTANTAPTGTPDTFDATEDETLNVPAPGVLGNDSDPEGDKMTALLFTEPQHGDVILNPDGSFSYTPDPNYFGQDTFVYRASDGVASSANTTVTINIADAPDTPTANPDSYEVDEDGTLTVNAANGTLVNDTNIGAGTMQIVSAPANGNFTPQTSGAFTYTPLANFSGEDTFTYKVINTPLGESNTAVVTITVNPINDAPVANDDTYSTQVDTQLNVSTVNGVLANDIEVDPADTLTATVNTDVTNGTLTLNSDGSFTYTPNAGYIGSDSFTYDVSDGTVIDTATVTINVLNASLELLDNGSFEAQGAGKRKADGWVGTNLLSGDRRLCKPGKSFDGDCAYRMSFNGKSNFTRMVSQAYATQFTVQPGDSVTVLAQVKAAGLSEGGSIRIVVRYQDGTKGKMSVIIPSGTYGYQELSRTMPLTKAVKKISVQVMYNGKLGNGGTFFVDNVSLLLSQPLGNGFGGLSVPTGDALPLPAAPADMRGN